MPVSDTAVGAILEIPTQALDKIKQAQKAIENLSKASQDAANAVKNHWGEIATQGLDKFIQKITDAKGKLSEFGSKGVTINTNGIEKSLTQAAQTTETQSQKISAGLQRIAMSDVNFSNFKELEALVRSMGLRYKDLEQAVKDYNAQRTEKKIDSTEANDLNKKIELVKEYLRVKKMSEERQSMASAAIDRDYLTEQKRLLTDMLTIRKQLNAEQISGARKFQTGADTSAERESINALLQRLREVNAAYRELNRTKSESLSAKGQTEAENNVLRAELALLKETASTREKLNQTISRGSELANQAKLKSAGLGSSDDAIYQRTLTGLYQDQIKVLRDIGRVRADVASEGRRASDSEIEKLTLLAEKYRSIQTVINNMSGKYTKIDQNTQSNFTAERDRQIIENTILKEQAERKYQETLAKTQQIVAGKFDMSATIESLGRFRQEEQKIHDQLVRLQNLIRKLQSERIDIQVNMKADLAKQIAPLTERLRELRALTQQPLGSDKLREYYREMDILKEKIAAMTAQARSQSASTPALLGNQEQIDALVTRYNALSAEMHKVGMEANKLGQTVLAMNEANIAIDAQAQRIVMLEQRLQSLNAIWERLKATNQAFDSSGNLTDKGQRLVKLENETKQEIQLRKMSASEAKRYEEQKTREAESESNKRIAQAKKEAREVKEALQAQKNKEIGNPLGAISYAQNATSLNALTDAYRNLQAVMAKTNPESSQWAQMNTQLGQTKAQIDAIKGKMGELRNQTQMTGNMMGQLKGQIAAAFSIGAVTGFIKKMVETRAQFELQRVALGAILQDRDEANKIFSQVQQMALQSPFTIMGLEKATKQMAAFGFEAKNLVANVKMIADLGAGLGVALDRIVLVMGHLKARNYLEGTMVRQFTNMGFNVLGELAKYYTEIEGKMVSVAEVQTRVKKKMVEFGDVEEVLKRVTSAGGMFYDMQKKQSESIWGQMQRITDAYDLMLNDIGRANEGPIKAALTLIRDLINHWRMLAPTIAAVGAAMTVVLAVQGVRLFIQSLNQLGTAVGTLALKWKIVATEAEAAAIAQKSASSATALGLILTILVSIGGVIAGIVAQANKLNSELREIESTGVGNMYDSIFQYRELADTIKDTTKSYEERKQAMDDMKRVFQEMLPDEMLEIENIRKMKDGYEEATEALKAYYSEKIKKQKEEKIEEEYGKKITEALKENSEAFANRTYNAISTLPQLQNIDKDVYTGAVRNIMDGIAEEVKRGDLKMKEASAEFQKRFMTMLGISRDDYAKISKQVVGGLDEAFANAFKDVPKWYSYYFGDAKGFESEFKDMEKQLGHVTELGIKSRDALEAEDALERYKRLENAVKSYTEAIEALAARKVELEKDNKEFGQIGYGTTAEGAPTFTIPGADEQTQAALDNVYEKLMLVETTARGLSVTFTSTANDVNGALASNVGQVNYFDSVFQNVLVKALNNYQRWGINLKTNNYLKNAAEEAKKSLNLLTDEQKTMILLAEKIAQKNGVAITTFDKMGWASIKTFDDARSAAMKLVGELEAQLLLMEQSQKEAGIWGEIVMAIKRAAGIGKTPEELRKEIEAIRSFYYAIGGSYPKEPKKKDKTTKTDTKTDTKTEDKQLKRWQEIFSLIKEANKQAEELNKEFDWQASADKTFELFDNQFKKLGTDIRKYFSSGWYLDEFYTDALSNFLKTINAVGDERAKFYSEVEKEISGEAVDVLVKDQKEVLQEAKKEIDAMFANYDLTKTLKDANVDVNLAFMVGGEPMSLDEIRKRLDDILAMSVHQTLRHDPQKYASQEMLKFYKDAQKKLTDIEYKELQQRLKNYHKYLAVMYSDRAKAMIDAHTMMANVTRDFNSYIAKLQEEAANPETTEERYQQIQEQIKMLESQSVRAIEGIRNELDQKLNKFDWEAFKGSDVFTKMYQDMDNLSKKGIDVMIKRLEEMRKKLQSMDKVDYKAVKEITGHIEKLKDTRLNVASIKDLFDMIKKGEQLRRGANGTSEEEEQKKLVMAQEQQEYYENQLGTLDMIIALKRQEGQDADKTKNLTEDQLELYNQSEEKLMANRSVIAGQVEFFKRISKESSDNLATLENEVKALKKLNDIAEYLKEQFDKVYDSVVDVADALGADTEMWADFGKAIWDSIFSVITLTIQFKLLGKEVNNSLLIIGWVATALQTVAQLLVAIFQHHDKKLQKQIDELHDSVEDLERAYEKLGKAMDDALNFGIYNANYDQAKRILEERIQKQKEIIALEEDKKKKDKDAIRDAKQEIEDLEEELTELRNRRIEAMGSRTDFLSAATDFVDTWLDAFRETGSGVDALRDHWKEFLDTLVVKQAAAALVSKRLEKVIGKINDAIDRGLTGTQLSSVIKSATDEWNSGAGELNEALKQFFEAMGIDLGNAELGLSDLQKGIQNITEPQAAAIEAYLNSMRYAVFRHTEQLDTLIAAVQAQYAVGVDNPVVMELKGIRSVLDSIDMRLGSVIGRKGIESVVKVG